MKKVLIVGASSGIGFKLAEIFASNGFMVGASARRIEPLMQLKDRYPGNVECEAIDVTDSDAPRHLEALADRMGGMDIYLHVAGIGYDNPGLDSEREAEVINTNSTGFARMVSAAYRYFRDKGMKGHIVALTSVAGTNGMGGMAAYSASKRMAQTYLVALEQLAHDEKADVVFTDIRPGWIRTPLLHDGRKYPMEMTADYAVPLMLRAIARKKRVAVIDWRWNVVVGLWRMIPNRLWTRMWLPAFS